MKKQLSIAFMLAPTVLLPFVCLWPEGIGGWVSLPWIVCTLACFIWGFLIYRPHDWLGSICLLVGFVHLLFVLLLPFLITPKTRARVASEQFRAGNSDLRQSVYPEPGAAEPDDNRWPRFC